MRTKNLFRTLAAATLAVISMSAFGQAVTTTGSATAVKNGPGPLPANISQTEVVDFVTVGSKMPYIVNRDVDIQSLVDGVDFLTSVWNWRIAAAGTGTATLTQWDSNSSLDSAGVAPSTGFFTQDSINVSFGATADVFTLSVSEQSRNTLGLPTCFSSTDTTLTIYAMPRPSLSWAEASFTGPIGASGDRVVGGCGVASTTGTATVNIPISLDSYTSDVKIAYSYQKYTLAGAPDGAAVTQSLAASAFYNATGDTWLTATPSSPNSGVVTLVALSLPDADASAANRQAAYGKWVFTITGVNDRTSRKSNIANTNADLPGAVAGQTFTLYSLPTPITGTIKHVANTGW